MTRLAVVAAVIVLLGTGIGLASAFVLPAQYAARAEILYEVSSEKPSEFLRQDRGLTTQLVMLHSRRVLGPVAASEHIRVEDLEKQVSSVVLSESEVIQVEARADSPEAAIRRSKAVVDGYLREAQRNSTSNADQYLREQLASVQQDLTAARAGQSPSATGLADREQQLLSQIDKLNAEQGGGPQLLTQPYPVDQQVSPQPWLTTLTGALAGLLVAAGVVAVAARRWTRAVRYVP
ncbi:hypothetical protein [Saccharopolyspora oryzae]|uniref:Polysaccharide chain length determinant N-terminal domain-containing protein n=1 Tax=Saccharopolyspora oryzae TaxID=2997343 RepID=A0ABT4UR94_9PSEU|nr:hypothetical protein [Saccharopolyspora oryzae]MDA3624184.1 hypothetical protein [Saccharopolyspora oryzae]